MWTSLSVIGQLQLQLDLLEGERLLLEDLLEELSDALAAGEELLQLLALLRDEHREDVLLGVREKRLGLGIGERAGRCHTLVHLVVPRVLERRGRRAPLVWPIRRKPVIFLDVAPGRAQQATEEHVVALAGA